MFSFIMKPFPQNSLLVLEPPRHGESINVVSAGLLHFSLGTVAGFHAPDLLETSLEISDYVVKLWDGQTDPHFLFIFSL